jgi:hypothetical protein
MMMIRRPVRPWRCRDRRRRRALLWLSPAPDLRFLRHSAVVLNWSASMTLADLDRPAELILWPGHAPAHVAQGSSFPTLRAALAAAAKAIQTENAKPWITTERGDRTKKRCARRSPASAGSWPRSGCKFGGAEADFA